MVESVADGSFQMEENYWKYANDNITQSKSAMIGSPQSFTVRRYFSAAKSKLSILGSSCTCPKNVSARDSGPVSQQTATNRLDLQE